MLFAFFLSFSFAFLNQNNTIISNLIIKGSYSHSPLIQFSSITFQTSAFFKNIYYSYSYSQFLSVTSKGSITIANSTFRKLMDAALKASLYTDPNEPCDGGPYTKGVLNIDGGTVEAANFTVLSCHFEDYVQAPAIIAKQRALRLFTCTFANILNNGVAIAGGAVHASNCDDFLVNDCTFTNCKSNLDGGGFYCVESRLTVFRTGFTDCNSFARGGAFYYLDRDHIADVVVQSCSFEKCMAPLNSGYFYIGYPSTPDTSVVLIFDRFECTKAQESSYITIDTTSSTPISVSRFRNEYEKTNVNVHRTATSTFTPSPSPSNTYIFSQSNLFSPSDVFTTSEIFTISNAFTQSLPFLPTSPFSPSFSFTPSISFTKSYAFSSSESFSPSDFFISHPASTPPQTPFPTNSYVFSGSDLFTESISFSPEATALPFATPALTRTPCVRWPNLSLGLLILGLLILLAGIIINIYLCCLCCKPSEIFAQQYV